MFFQLNIAILFDNYRFSSVDFVLSYIILIYYDYLGQFTWILGRQLKWLPAMSIWTIFFHNLNFIYIYILITFVAVPEKHKIMIVIMGILNFFLNFNYILLISPSSYIVYN